MNDRSELKIELRACAACGAVVVDEDRHFDWHVAVRQGAGPALHYRPDYEPIGLIDAIDETQLYDVADTDRSSEVDPPGNGGPPADVVG